MCFTQPSRNGTTYGDSSVRGRRAHGISTVDGEPQKCGGYLRRPHHHHHQNRQVIWNVQFITVFVPAWMIPPVYHSLRRESIKTTSSASPIGVQSVRPTWFEDTTPRDTTSQQLQDPQKEQPQPLHGLKLVIKEEVLPATDQPQFQSLERGLLAPDTWKCKRAQVSLKATIDVPMLGTIIEENGDGLLEYSHMPEGWPLHIDGAVRQCCIHRAASYKN